MITRRASHLALAALAAMATLALSSCTFQAREPKVADRGPAGIPTEPRDPARCAKADIRDKHPQLREFLSKPRNQDGIGWCYAYEAADLLTVRLGVPVSAVDLSITYNFEDISAAFDRLFGPEEVGHGGDEIDAMEHARKRGVCTEEHMPSEGNPVAEQSRNVLNTMKRILRLKDRVRSGISYEQFVQESDCAAVLKDYMPGLDARSLYKILKASAAEAVDTALYRLAQRACEGKRLRIPAQARFKTMGKTLGKKRLFKEMDAQLSNGVPVGLSINSAAFNWDGHSGEHGVVVLAREFRNGSCKYLIRNSWGPGCNYYNEEAKKDCNAAEGSFWLSEQAIERHLRGIQYAN